MAEEKAEQNEKESIGTRSSSSALLGTYVDVPIEAAKRIAKEFDKNQVIVVCWDNKHGKSHVTTYGKSKLDCALAAKGGNFVKTALGWPESMCNAKPERT